MHSGTSFQTLTTHCLFLVSGRPTTHCLFLVSSSPTTYCLFLVSGRPTMHCLFLVCSRPTTHCLFLVCSRPTTHCLFLVSGRPTTHFLFLVCGRPITRLYSRYLVAYNKKENKTEKQHWHGLRKASRTGYVSRSCLGWQRWQERSHLSGRHAFPWCTHKTAIAQRDETIVLGQKQNRQRN